MQAHNYYAPTPCHPPANVPNPAGYPLKELGTLLAPAVIRHQVNTGVAVEMIASYARSISHVCVQDLFDVQRPRCAPSPVCAYDLVSADSSEGKDTASRPFIGFLRKYEEEQTELNAAAHLDRLADTAAWKAQMRALNKRLDQAATEGDDLKDLKIEHKQLIARRPDRAADPKLIVDNVTPGALENMIGAGSKSLFITSTEAGGLLNGRLGRSTDLLNNAWDATPIPKDRVDKERTFAIDYRVSGHLALQGPVLQSIFARTGHLAHGSGLTARMLLTVPHSTLGNRFLRSDQSATFDEIDALGERVTALLKEGAARRQRAEARRIIVFSEQAARYFDDTYNHIQANLGRGQILHDVAAHAGKSAEQIARIAGMLYGIEGREGPLQVDVLERARIIGYWHLDQFLAHFGSGQPGDQRVIDGQVVRQALVTIASRGLGYIARGEVKKWCTKPLTTVRFDQAMQLLIDQGYVLLHKRGRTLLVAANLWR
ncbi:DUF3987 domain-containing protein [Variovorax sp. KBS0712]|uniref:DUF3987 domain-containing protein n=1 Tax=Variovorax sp. KBS0712 TaxID=2578111 RepID=UPI00111BC869|nr:DUF3987 domain-containing protein [Variovorax sp. KBS0712]TSD56928.1 DUF3987 domain-containing protein [Variovorax sp. KBS0712]